MIYRKYNTYGQLRTVLLGSFFFPEYFSKIKNPNVRDPLMQMAKEINEDLEGITNVLKSYGCDVLRAEQPTGYLDIENVYIPPIEVRNNHAVIGNQLYQLNRDFKHSSNTILNNYCSDMVNLVDANEEFFFKKMLEAKSNYNHDLDLWYSKSKYDELAGNDWPDYYDYVKGVRPIDPMINNEIASFKSVLEYETKEVGSLQGPNVINTNDTLYVDANEYCDYATWLGDRIQDSRPIKQFTSKAGHVDGCFAILNSNTILGIDPLIDYANLFPNHKLISLPLESGIPTIKEFKIMADKVKGSWWLAGQEYNDELIEFVETYLKSWAGYISESVFEVNVLSINENTVLVTDISPDLEKQLKNQGIDCIIVPWRHRFFLDGGLHCITLDLHREGPKGLFS
jgi:hypothetical protein